MKPIKFYGKPNEIGNAYFSIYKDLPIKNYEMIIQVPKTDRSKDQNAIYWKLLTDYAKWGQIDINVLHNQMLGAYGIFTGIYAVVPEEVDVESLPNMHLKKTSKVVNGKDGKNYVYCQILKGSHELTKDEMSNLITGLKNEIVGSGADEIIDVEEI